MSSLAFTSSALSTHAKFADLLPPHNSQRQKTALQASRMWKIEEGLFAIESSSSNTQWQPPPSPMLYKGGADSRKLQPLIFICGWTHSSSFLEGVSFYFSSFRDMQPDTQTHSWLVFLPGMCLFLFFIFSETHRQTYLSSFLEGVSVYSSCTVYIHIIQLLILSGMKMQGKRLSIHPCSGSNGPEGH